MQNQVTYDMLGQKFYSNQQTKTSYYVSIHLRSHINNSSECSTGISKHSTTMDKNPRAARSCYHHYFLVFGYPGETLALVVHILYHIHRPRNEEGALRNGPYLKTRKCALFSLTLNDKQLLDEVFVICRIINVKVRFIR